MRIISNFTDYYDVGCKYDTDRTTMWVRNKCEPVQYNVGKVVPRGYGQFGPWRKPTLYTSLHIGFCGNYYPVFITQMHHDTKRTCVYDPEIIKDFGWGSDSGINILNYFKEHPTLGLQLHDEFGPVFGVFFGPTELVNYGNQIFPKRKHLLIIKNIALKEFGFNRIIAPHLAYNDLYKAVCNMAQPRMQIPEMDNDVKIQQAGFDLKKSFRKRKTGP